MTYLDKRRAAVIRAWNLSDEIVLIGSGQPIPIPGTDEFYKFHAHPEFRYLADNNLPGHVLAFDARGGWTEFVPVLGAEQKLWLGGAQAPGEPIAHLDAWLAARAGRPHGMLGVPCLESYDEDFSGKLREVVDAARRKKDGEELERMRKACLATGAGFEAARAAIRPGATERQVQIELERDFRRAGGAGTAFDSIVAGGPHAAVLHHTPGERVLRDGELVLVDAGARYAGYSSDVTRTYPAGGSFTPEQKDVYAVVRAAQVAAIGRCRAGAEFREIHLATAVDLARGLADLGILRGDAEGLVERHAHALFFPHGLGHLLGLATHDSGGYLVGRAPAREFGLRYLRTDLPLQPGYVVTIEPGLYFIPALLDDPARREAFADAVDWERIGKMRDFGGIRIEDDVLVTDGEPEILTSSIPK